MEDLVSRLPDELKAEVLLRLPVKLLLRLKFVHNLITHNSWFARSHLQISLRNRDIITADNFIIRESDSFSKLAAFLRQKSSSSCRFIFRDEKDSIRLVGCCDGILCLYKWNKGGEADVSLDDEADDVSASSSLQIYLYNPALFQYRDLPPIYGYYCDKVCFVSDPRTKDYKVVVMACKSSLSPAEVFIYSFRHNCWKTIVTHGMHRGIYEIDHMLVIHNGNPHWIAWPQTKDRERSEMVVNLLDVSEETIREIHLPDECKKLWIENDSGIISYLHIERYKGCLAVTYDDLRFLMQEPVAQFWVMEDEDSKCWVKMVIKMGLPSSIYDGKGDLLARVCREPWGNTSWTYVIDEFYSDGSSAILTDVEDEKSAQKCKGINHIGNPRSYTVAHYVSTFVSVRSSTHSHRKISNKRARFRNKKGRSFRNKKARLT